VLLRAPGALTLLVIVSSSLDGMKSSSLPSSAASENTPVPRDGSRAGAETTCGLPGGCERCATACAGAECGAAAAGADADARCAVARCGNAGSCPEAGCAC
jgi:hypothetical protein